MLDEKSSQRVPAGPAGEREDRLVEARPAECERCDRKVAAVQLAERVGRTLRLGELERQVRKA